MPSLNEVRIAKSTFRQQFPNLMVGISKSESDDGWALAVRIPEGSTKKDYEIPDNINGVPIYVKEVSYDIRKQEHEDGTSDNG